MTTRREVLKMGAAACGTAALSHAWLNGLAAQSAPNEELLPHPLEEFGYGAVTLMPGRFQSQFTETQTVLMGLNEDALLAPFRVRDGLAAPGPRLGGWYDEGGFCPGHTFGQWISALSRGYAVDHDPAKRARVEKLLHLYGQAINGKFFTDFRFPAYVYDKLVIGMIDAHEFAGISNAFALLDKTTDAAQPHLEPMALDRDAAQRSWRASIGDKTTDDYTWDEPYTLPENLYLAAKRGAGERYRTMAGRYLLDRTWFDPLAANENVLAGHHAYSFCNSLSSAMQAYLSAGSAKHLQAARNGFAMIRAQSFATGGWGPDESFVEPGSGALAASLTKTRHSFETPCGSYAHIKITRYLMRVTGDGSYGDSMEQVIWNTVLGAKALEPNGRAFYYSDYSNEGGKFYFPDAWPCCSGTLPQVTADYRIAAYLRGSDGVYVNLYLPSELRWTSGDGAQWTLSQSGDYPLDERVTLRLSGNSTSEFALRLRLPQWTTCGGETMSARVNGAPVSLNAERGFATIRRKWRSGDTVELTIPLPMRVVQIEPGSNTVALMRGPLVLFPLTHDSPAATRKQMLTARRTGKLDWAMESSDGLVRLKPFFAIGDEPYRTYLDVATNA
jgi:DUF1680 family protein